MTYLHCNWRHDEHGKLVAFWYEACKLPEKKRFINDTEFGDIPMNDFHDHLELKYGEDAYSIEGYSSAWDAYLESYEEFDR